MATFIEELVARLSLDTDEGAFKRAESLMDQLAAATQALAGTISAATESAEKIATEFAEASKVNKALASSSNGAAKGVDGVADSFKELDQARPAEKIKKIDISTKELTASAVKMGAVIGAAFSAVQAAAVGLVVNYANNAKQVENLSRVAGEGFEAFQLYAAGAKTVGVEQDKLADIFKDTNDKIGDFLQTGAGPMADFFEQIGPKVGITAEMFKDLSGKDALQLYVDGLERANLSQAEMTFYMEAIASDATLLLPLLKNGGVGFSAMADEALAAGAVISESGAKSAKALNTSFAMLQLWITGLGNDIAEELIPTVTEVVEGIRLFIKENKALISSAITGTIKAAAIALKGLAAATALFAAFKLGQIVLATAAAVNVLTKAFTAGRLAALLFNGAVLAIPILIGLAIAALALLADDMYTFFQGGESYIGDFVAKWPMLGDAIYGVADALKVAFGFANDLGSILLSILTLDFGRLMDSFQSLGNRIIDVFRNVGQAISDSLPPWVADSLGSVFGAADSVGSAFSGPSSGGFLGASPMIAPAAASAAVSNSSSRTMQDNRQYNITGTDIGEVKRVLNEKNAFAAKTIDTGVEY